MHNEQLKLIYFEGCPNAEIAVKRLEEAGISFERVCQDSLEDDSPYKAYASPTLLNGRTIVFGAATSNEGGCSLDLPTIDEIKIRLKASSSA